jgi:hypothetical protein
MRLNGVLRWTLVPAAALLLCLAACGEDEEDDLILMTSATFTVPNPSLLDPLVFLQKNPTDTTDADNFVMVDVMLRHTNGVTFRGFTLELTFDPSVARVGQVDLASTPLGDCGGGGLCPLLCLDSASATNDANLTGTLVLGVGAQQCGPSANVTGTQKLLTLGFIGASVGSTVLTLVDDGSMATQGDCEILDSNGDRLPIPCNRGGATITVSR